MPLTLPVAPGFREILLILLLLAVAGCDITSGVSKPPAAGTASYRTETTSPDGTTTKTEVVYTAPESDAKGSSLLLGTLDSPSIAATFGGQYEPAKPLPSASAGHNMGQYILYGCGAVCVMVGLGLIGVGRHIKLGTLAFIGSGVFFTLAVTIDQFAWIYAYLLGAGILIVLSVIGWALWRDYQDDQRINLSRLNNSDQHINAKPA